jgi:hypothetical protein
LFLNPEVRLSDGHASACPGRADFDAAFGKYGCALVISLHEDGTIFNCEVAHSAHQKKQFSSVGSIEAPDFTYGDGKVKLRRTDRSSSLATPGR